MKDINDQPQNLLARYADRVGCDKECQHPDDTSWIREIGFNTTKMVERGFKIRLVLTHGLPSHLPPYKENPRDPGDGYRVPTVGDPFGGYAELRVSEQDWETLRADKRKFQGHEVNDYRLPATVMPPDWEEMTREKKPEIGDQCPLCKNGELELEPQFDCSCHISPPCHHCTDRELRCDTCPGEEPIKEARPTIGILRPISEMPDDVPEGCLRLHCKFRDGDIQNSITRGAGPEDTHFVDIQIPAPPDPLVEERTAFETWWSKLPGRSGKHKAECFEAWKGAKGL